ncbi:MAG: EthD domain-containing protein [Actinomycetales bacterium]
MYKVLIGLTRREDMTHEEFLDWWLNQHAPLARTLPGIRGITFNLLDGDLQAAPFDGIAELWFDSPEAMTEAYSSEVGKGVAADSLAHVSARVRMPVVERRILSA